MNNHFISKLVRFILYGLVAVSVVTIFSNIMQIDFMNGLVDGIYSEDTVYTLAEKNDARVELIGGVQAICYLCSMFIIFRWLYVSAKINHLSGIKGLSRGPGWSVGWFFVPFANLVMPYRALKENFRASFNNENWQANKVPYYFPIWWAAFLIQNLCSGASTNMWRSIHASETFSYDLIIQASTLDIVTDVILIINAIFLLKIVNIVSENQKDKEFHLSVTK